MGFKGSGGRWGGCLFKKRKMEGKILLQLYMVWHAPVLQWKKNIVRNTNISTLLYRLLRRLDIKAFKTPSHNLKKNIYVGNMHFHFFHLKQFPIIFGHFRFSICQLNIKKWWCFLFSNFWYYFTLGCSDVFPSEGHYKWHQKLLVTINNRCHWPENMGFLA